MARAAWLLTASWLIPMIEATWAFRQIGVVQQDQYFALARGQAP
jgi:hypothetical protein